MASLSLYLPITPDSGDGFTMLKSIDKLIRQNLKMLLLTAPGERVMDPNFGVGVRNYLFSSYHEGVEIEIRNRIRVTD